MAYAPPFLPFVRGFPAQLIVRCSEQMRKDVIARGGTRFVRHCIEEELRREAEAAREMAAASGQQAVGRMPNPAPIAPEVPRE